MAAPKVVFLDIDGVICCNMAGRLEEPKLATLQGVIRATGAKVCLSTDWRRQANLKRQVVATLKRLDIEVIGATPMRAMFQPIRPQEITEWYHANREKFGITHWVAIDDRDLLNEHGGAELNGHMVRTHPNTGLTKRLADVAIDILGGERAAPGPELSDDVSKEARGRLLGAGAWAEPARIHVADAAVDVLLMDYCGCGGRVHASWRR